MESVQVFLTMASFALIISFFSYYELVKLKVSSIKVMIFGVGLIAFSGVVLKDIFKYGIDQGIALIGLSFCIIGFIMKDNIK